MLGTHTKDVIELLRHTCSENKSKSINLKLIFVMIDTFLGGIYAPHSNAMGFLSLPEASLHYLHTFDAMRQFKYHI